MDLYYTIDWNGLWHGVSFTIAFFFLLYIVPYLMKRGYESGKIHAIWSANKVLNNVLEQGKNMARDEMKKERGGGQNE